LKSRARASGPSSLIAALVAAACGGRSTASLPPSERDAGAPVIIAQTRDDGGAPANAPPEPSPTFAGLYRDIFSVQGAARCQHTSCHGGTDGNAGLSMGEGAWGVYRALTTYSYDGRRLVAAAPGEDARGGSALLAVTSPASGIMPRVDEEVGNRSLTIEEWSRLEAWLATGGAF
jgi:hypothetical protein